MRLQDTYIVEYILGSIDLLIFLIASIQLIRIVRNEKEQQQRVRLNVPFEVEMLLDILFRFA